MSATNRGRERSAHDDYPTPLWCVRRLIDALDLPEHWQQTHARAVLEPCAGRGAIVRQLVELGVHPANVTAVELQGELLEDLRRHRRGGEMDLFVGDFLGHRSGKRFDLIVTNPPYKLAESIILHALEMLAPGGRAAFLLRLNFIAGGGRVELMQALRPDVYVLPNRPGFTADFGRTDACEYAWFVFGDDVVGRLSVLDPTPVDVRRRDHGALCAQDGRRRRRGHR